MISTPRGWRFAIPAGDARSYRLAQIDDYAHLGRTRFLQRPPVVLALQARVSSARVPGTWGFGLWNDPFGAGCMPTAIFPRPPAFPQAAWFFSASERSHLSLRDDKPAKGFIAQCFSSQAPGLWLAAAGVLLPLAPRRSRQILSRHVLEDAATVPHDPLSWHRYEIRWHAAAARFFVDDDLVLDSTVSPRPPLGIVIWIDNQRAAFTSSGKLTWGTEHSKDESWLEVQDLTLTQDAVQ